MKKQDWVLLFVLMWAAALTGLELGRWLVKIDFDSKASKVLRIQANKPQAVELDTNFINAQIYSDYAISKMIDSTLRKNVGKLSKPSNRRNNKLVLSNRLFRNDTLLMKYKFIYDSNAPFVYTDYRVKEFGCDSLTIYGFEFTKCEDCEVTNISLKDCNDKHYFIRNLRPPMLHGDINDSIIGLHIGRGDSTLVFKGQLYRLKIVKE